MLWDVQAFPLFSKVQAVEFLPGGGEIIAGGEDGSIRVFRHSDGAQTRAVTGLPSAVGAVRVSPDGRLAATCSFVHEGTEQTERTVRVWRVSDLAPLAQLAGHSRGVRNVAWSRDGRWLATCDTGGTVLLWDVATGSVSASATPTTWPVMDVEFAPDGSLIALDFAGTFFQLTVPGFAVVRAVGTPLHSCFSSMTVTQDGRHATALAFGQLAWLDLATGLATVRSAQMTQCYAAVPTPKLPFVAFGGLGGTKEIEFWDVRSRSLVATLDCATQGSDFVLGLGMRPGGPMFAYGTFRGRLVYGRWLNPLSVQAP